MDLKLLFCMIVLIYSAWGKNTQNQFSDFPAPFEKGDYRLQKKKHANNYRYSQDSELVKRFQQLSRQNAEFSSIGTQCAIDFLGFIAGFGLNKTFPFLVLDSFGRPESGQILGNIRWMGDFDECVLIDDESTLTNFKGKHCSVNYKQPTSNDTSYIMGICIPDSCGNDDAKILGGLLIPLFGTSVAEIESATCYFKKEYSASDIVALIIISLFSLLSLCGTFADLTVGDKESRKHMLIRLLLCFSWWTNGNKLLSAKAGSGQLSCLNGLRTLSMFWVILGHTVFFPLVLNIENLLFVWFKIVPRFDFQAIRNGDFAVDTFFVLSGLLVAYLTLNALEKNRMSKAKFWGLFYFHRFWRLTPVYMLCVMFYMTIFMHIPSGPWARSFDEFLGDTCKYWWTNLLYINNFHPAEGNTEFTCMSWTWYLANDMQFFILSPLIMLLLHYFWIAGIIVSALLMVGSIIATGIVTHDYELYPDTLYNIPGAQEMELQIYVKPYFRCVPYLVGLVVGWSAVKFKKGVKLPQLLVFGGWIFAGASCMALMYGLLPYRDGSATLNVDLGYAYQALKRITWALGVAWVAFACINGYGGPVNWLLSWKIWIPLGRLTYCAYLLHPILMYDFLLNMKRDFYMDGSTIALYYIAFLVSTYILAIFVSLTFESPFMALEKLFLGPPSEKKEKRQEKDLEDLPREKSKLDDLRISSELDDPLEKKSSEIFAANGTPVSYINGGFTTDSNGTIPNGHHTFVQDNDDNVKNVEQF